MMSKPGPLEHDASFEKSVSVAIEHVAKEIAKS